jgi:hypothetical protein
MVTLRAKVKSALESIQAGDLVLISEIKFVVPYALFANPPSTVYEIEP